MNTNPKAFLLTGQQAFKNQLDLWHTSAKTRHEELNMIRKKVYLKFPNNDLEQQIKNDVIWNLDRMMVGIQRDLMRPLLKLDRQLQSSNNFDIHNRHDLQMSYTELSVCVKNMNRAFKDLKNRSKHFLKRRDFGIRHGFYRSFLDGNQSFYAIY